MLILRRPGDENEYQWNVGRTASPMSTRGLKLLHSSDSAWLSRTSSASVKKTVTSELVIVLQKSMKCQINSKLSNLASCSFCVCECDIKK